MFKLFLIKWLQDHRHIKYLSTMPFHFGSRKAFLEQSHGGHISLFTKEAYTVYTNSDAASTRVFFFFSGMWVFVCVCAGFGVERAQKLFVQCTHSFTGTVSSILVAEQICSQELAGLAFNGYHNYNINLKIASHITKFNNAVWFLWLCIRCTYILVQRCWCDV